jgi:lysophospholipase L1-like esterase
MAIKGKKGGVYVDPVGVFVKKAGAYSPAVGVFVKGAGAYVSTAVYPLDAVGGALPVFAYSDRKLRSGYSGPAYRVLRVADSAEQDIGFVGQNIDSAALDAFLGSSIGRILNYYDQSGSGNTTSQTTASLRPYVAKLVDRGWTVLDVASKMALPASVSLNTQAFNDFHVIEKLTITQSGVVELGVSPNRFAAFGQPTRYQTIFGFSAVNRLQTFKPVVLESEGSPSRQMFAQDSEQVTAGALSSAAMVGGWDGGSSTAGYEQTAYRDAAIGYGRVLSDPEKTLMRNALQSLFGINTVATRRLVYVGDSISAAVTAPSTALFYNGYAKQNTRRLPRNVGTYSYSVGAQQLQSFIPTFATTTGAILDAFTDTRVVFLHMGTNDLTLGARTAAQIYGDIQTYAGLVRAKGAKIVVSTLLPNGFWDATQLATRNDLNALIRANWATFADGFADFGADATMGVPAAALDTTLYLDRLHPTQLGHSYLSLASSAAIAPLL